MREGEGAALPRLISALPPEHRDQVFTHTSWAPDRASSYERLEFLGDSVLELAIARTLYDRFPDASEGRLAKIRAHVVSRQSCAAVARTLDLGAVLVARAQDVPGPELHRISLSRNVLAALLEAAIAAVYLEYGYDVVAPAIVEAFDDRIEYASTGHVDSKTELQEALARTRASGAVRGSRGRWPAARAPVRLRGADRRRAARHGSWHDEEGGRARGRGRGTRCARRVSARGLSRADAGMRGGSDVRRRR